MSDYAATTTVSTVVFIALKEPKIAFNYAKIRSFRFTYCQQSNYHHPLKQDDSFAPSSQPADSPMISTTQALQLLFPKASTNELSELRQTFLTDSQVIEAPSDTPLFSPGDSCEHYLFLLQGQVKVFATAANGKEILLYRIQSGETCVLSTNCMMGSRHYPASAKTETPCLALSVPIASLQQAMETSSLINRLLMDNFARRIGSLIELVSEVALERLDVRLARHLLQLCDDKQTIHTTHEALATEIGTAREVISRQLRQLEQQGWIKTARGLIQITDTSSIQSLSDGFFCQ